MTFTHWYRDNEPKSSKSKSKIKNTLNRLDYRLRSTVSEARSFNNLRQEAGLDRPMTRTTKCFRKSAGGEPRVFKHKLKVPKCRVPQFRSKPVPNFSAHHKLWEKRNHMRQMNSKHKITAAETPQTLLTSMEAKKRWKAKKMQILHLENKEVTLQPNLSKQSLQLWRKRPFVPRIQSSFVQTEPFRLRTEERAKHRKEFDEWNALKQQALWRYRSLEWQRLCKKESMAARKLTNFKAQPYPSKSLKCIRHKN